MHSMFRGRFFEKHTAFLDDGSPTRGEATEYHRSQSYADQPIKQPRGQ